VVGPLRAEFCRRFVAAVRDKPWPHIAATARLRITDVNTRPSEAARLLRVAERAESGESFESAESSGSQRRAPRDR
jgi:hypothetical protein